MAKRVTVETVLAAINGGALGMGNEDVKGTIDGDKIALFDDASDCGHISVVDGRIDLSAVDVVILASCFGKAEEWILSALVESTTEAMESKARVIDYQTSEELGEATPELAAASANAGVTGAVGAYKNNDGVWVHAPEGSWAPSEVRSVYVVSP